MPIFIDLLKVGAGLLATYLSTLAADFIASKVKNAKARDILLGLESAAADAVAEVWQTSVEAAKRASEDGKLPKETAEAAKAQAIATVKSYLGQKGIDAIMRALGWSAAQTDAVIANKIEKAIYNAKRASSPRIHQTTAAL